MSRLKLAYTAGEAIGPEIFAFYRSLGINIKQLYGQTEAAVFVCVQPDREVKADTVGTPFTDVEVKVTEAGEVWYRGPGVFHSYYKNPRRPRRPRRRRAGCTGDAGYFDDAGHLKIIDRAKDVGRLADGRAVRAEVPREQAQVLSPHQGKRCVGDQRDCASAFINIDVAAVGDWAEGGPRVFGLPGPCLQARGSTSSSASCVEKVNRDLAADAKLANSQIRRFLVLPRSSTPTTASSRARARCAAPSSPRSTRRSCRRCTTAPRSAASTPRSSSRTGVAARCAPSSRSGMPPQAARIKWIRAPSPAVSPSTTRSRRWRSISRTSRSPNRPWSTPSTTTSTERRGHRPALVLPRLYEGCEIAPEAWERFAARGKHANITYGLGTVRVHPSERTRRHPQPRRARDLPRQHLRHARPGDGGAGRCASGARSSAPRPPTPTCACRTSTSTSAASRR